MNFAFDLISDLHVEPGEQFDWNGQQTSLYCVVAGDIARDRDTLLETLRHISSCYLGTLYIDGNDEHRDHMTDIDASYAELSEELQKIPGLIYLHNNVVVIDGIAFIGVNGWWNFHFNTDLELADCVRWYCDYVSVDHVVAYQTVQKAYNDAAYLSSTIRRLQKHPDVKSIIIVSHTVPTPELTDHDTDLVDQLRYNCVGNPHLLRSLEHDTANKVSMWCFGHYHRAMDREINSIQFISNPRGRINTPWCQNPYFARRIEVIPQAQ